MSFTRIFLFALLFAWSEAINLRNAQKEIGADLHAGHLLGSTHSSGVHRHARHLQGDFDWEVNLEETWPQISFEGATEDSEVRFKYNYTGTIVPNAKYVDIKLHRGDCITDASTQAVVMRNLVDDAGFKEITFDVDVLQATITNTPEYIEAADGLSADIVFCVRADYFYEDANGFKESVNFHETNVTITADLTANFTLTAIDVDRDAAAQAAENVEIDCSVQAYFCDENNADLVELNGNQPTFTQGDIMTVCVEIAPEDIGKYFLDDVIEMDMEQVKGDGSKDRSGIVLQRFPSPLSSKRCRNGICNMRHLIQSKFFDERDPNNLDLAGIALCGFGNYPQFSRRRSVGFTAAYVAAATELATSSAPQGIEACKTECADTVAGCEAFVANAVNAELDEWNCAYYDTHPVTESLENSASSEVYMVNDGYVAP